MFNWNVRRKKWQKYYEPWYEGYTDDAAQIYIKEDFLKKKKENRNKEITEFGFDDSDFEI